MNINIQIYITCTHTTLYNTIHKKETLFICVLTCKMIFSTFVRDINVTSIVINNHYDKIN